MKTRVQVSLNGDLIEKGKRLQAVRSADSFSELLEILIRDEWERRFGPVPLAQVPAHPQPTDPPAGSTEIIRKIQATKPKPKKSHSS
jgi:hypothetical protein